MTTYNSYQEAKIANPENEIVVTTRKYIDEFGVTFEFSPIVNSEKYKSGYKHKYQDASPRINDGYYELCNPADYCMTLEKFLSDGNKLEVGDVIFGEDEDDVDVVSSDLHCRSFNMPVDADRHIYILRAAALEKIPTETPEEKEALDSIESVGEVEWENGDECVISQKSKSKWLVVGVSPLAKTSTVCVSNTGELKSFHTDQLKKPETPQQREDRERLASAYDLYECGQSAIKCIGYEEFNSFKNDDCAVKFWLAIVDKTKYRKEPKS